jgi:hypothetical protein
MISVMNVGYCYWVSGIHTLPGIPKRNRTFWKMDLFQFSGDKFLPNFLHDKANCYSFYKIVFCLRWLIMDTHCHLVLRVRMT